MNSHWVNHSYEIQHARWHNLSIVVGGCDETLTRPLVKARSYSTDSRAADKKSNTGTLPLSGKCFGLIDLERGTRRGRNTIVSHCVIQELLRRNRSEDDDEHDQIMIGRLLARKSRRGMDDKQQRPIVDNKAATILIPRLLCSCDKV